MTIHEHLKAIGACQEARKWAKQFSTAEEVWKNNTRIDWLFWWVGKIGGQNEAVVKCAREYANDAVRWAAAAADAANAAADATNLAIAKKYCKIPWQEGRI